MLQNDLKVSDTRNLQFTLQYWKQINDCNPEVLSMLFNQFAKLFLSQASSTDTKRLFSAFGWQEGRESQYLLTSLLEMTHTIQKFISLII